MMNKSSVGAGNQAQRSGTKKKEARQSGLPFFVISSLPDSGAFRTSGGTLDAAVGDAFDRQDRPAP
jgi:hypothetical protein